MLDYEKNLRELISEIEKYNDVLVTGGGKIVNENNFQSIKGYRIISNSHHLSRYKNFKNIYINFNHHNMIKDSTEYKYSTFHKQKKGWKKLIETNKKLPEINSNKIILGAPSTGCLALWVAINSNCKNIFIDGFDVLTDENTEKITGNSIGMYTKKVPHNFKKEKYMMLEYAKKMNKNLYF